MTHPYELHLSPLERKFFKLYAVAAKQDYHIMQTAVSLMNPDELGVICPVHATRIASEMQELYSDFDASLNAVATKGDFVRKSVAASPTGEELVQLITVSFFKLVATVKTDAADPGKTADGGWFSGETENWQKNIAALKKSLAPSHKEPTSPLISAMLQLFNSLVNKKLPFLLSYQDSQQKQHDEEEWEEDDDNSAPEYFD